MAYHPQEGSTAFKVIEFLTKNAPEELTPEDVSAKFDKPRNNVHSLLGPAVLGGALTRGENEDGDVVYRLGKGAPLLKATPRAATQGVQGVWAPAKVNAKPRRVLRETIDVDTITIDTDIALPGCNGGITPDYTRLFARMAPGHSCLLPIAAQARLRKACTEFKKAGSGLMSISLIDDDSLRLFRVK